MGGNNCKSTRTSDKAITIAILGLDNAGKTTTARVLENVPVDAVAPTIGFSQTEITHKNEKIKLIDLGGAKTFREAWRHYYDDAYGFVYVLDSSEEDRLGENREVLRKLLQEEKVKGKPILILANKQDKAEALDKNAILEDIKLERLVNENRTLCRVELCTAKSMSRNGKHSKIDEPIRHGFDWLIKTVYEHYDALHKRVDEDVQKRNEAEKIAKRERQERVKKLREEREKEEGPENDNDEDESTLKNGFVPIGQAIKNAERNSSEKKTKEKSNRTSSNENGSLPPIAAPRSSSLSRLSNNDENNNDQEHSKRHNRDVSPQRKESPISRSNSTNFDENEQNNSTDEQTVNRAMPGKKKKVIGAGRHRSQGDGLPPLAPSSAASRRDDLTQSKGPPAGTPRPQTIVAQWAITSPVPQTTAEKLTTITSDNELDNDDEQNKHKSSKSTKRILSPHPTTTNRIINDKQNQSSINNNHSKKSSQSRREEDSNDEENNDNSSRRSSSAQKNHSKLNHDDDDEEFNKLSNKRTSSLTRKTTNGDSSHRSHSRNSRNNDDDDDDR